MLLKVALNPSGVGAPPKSLCIHFSRLWLQFFYSDGKESLKFFLMFFQAGLMTLHI